MNLTQLIIGRKIMEEPDKKKREHKMNTFLFLEEQKSKAEENQLCRHQKG